MLPSLNLLYQIKHACLQVCIPNYAVSLTCSPQFDPVHCITAFCSDALVITPNLYPLVGLSVGAKKQPVFSPLLRSKIHFFPTTSKHLTPPPKNPIKVSKSSMGPSSVPSFVPLIVQLLSTKIVHFYDKSMKLCQITTNPKTNIFGYGAKPNSTLDTSTAQALKWPT